MPFNSVIFFGSPLSNKKRGRCAAPLGLGFDLLARTVAATAAGWIASLARVVAAVSLFGHVFDSFYPGRLELDDPGEGWLAQRAREGDGGKGRLRAFGFHGEDLD